MKTVLVYVISCPGHPYEMLMNAQMETWDSQKVDGVSTLYYTGLLSYQKPNIVQFNSPEGYNNMGRKDLLAFKWALNNCEWDYMARVNSSCYVKKKKLLDYVQSIPESKLFRGLGVCGKDGQVEWMWGGGQYIMSRDVVQSIVDNESKWDHSVMEDVAMSKLVKVLGFDLDTMGRSCSINRGNNSWTLIGCEDNHGIGFDFNDFKDVHKAENQFFIRVKQDQQRHVDVEIMRQLFDNGL